MPITDSNKEHSPTKLRVNLTGRRFGRLTVQQVANRKARNTFWECKCDCGNTACIVGYSLTNGDTQSCGCLQRERSTAYHLRHGLSHTKVHGAWSGMLQRCTNPNNPKYPRYGERGIKVCEHWKIFENFLADMGYPPSPKHTIDRIDNNGNYEPSNCRWATPKEQGRNRRSTRFITLDGDRRSVADWAEATGIKGCTIRYRLHHNWSPAQILGIEPSP